MQRFFSSVHRFFSRKLVVMGLAVIAMLVGLVGGGRFVIQSRSSASTATCLSYSTVSCNTSHHRQAAPQTTQSVAAIAYHNDVKRAAPAPKLIRAKRVIPTPTRPVATTPPQPTNPPAPTGSVTAMIQQVFGPYASGALNVARCESGLNPNAYNPTSIGGSHAAGVFQILYPSTWRGTSQAGSSPYNAWANIQAAHEIFVRDGYSWREWSCAP